MIKVFFGDDRLRAEQEIIKFLGSDYEVVEGETLSTTDLPSIFLGNSLFSSQRSILIRDLTQNQAAYEALPAYLNTPHKIIIFETKLDKRNSVYKELKDKIEFKEFLLPKDPDFSLVFNIYKTAKTNGRQAIGMLEKIKAKEDPLMFFGLLVSQAIKDYEAKPDQKRALRELSKIDILMKTTSCQPWLLIESFLLQLSSF